MASHGVMALIPARGGSKGVPKKNVYNIGGYPLLAYSIVCAKLSTGVERVLVSTDSPEIADTARAYGAEVPFLRPAELAQDNSPDIDFIAHALNWLDKHENYAPGLILHLRPTTPLRNPALINEAIRSIQHSNEATSLRSVHQLAEPPQKMMKIENNYLSGFFPNDPRPEYYNLPRQAFPPAYHPNGYVDILKSNFIQSSKSLHGPRILAFVTPITVEVDRLEDLEYLSFQVEKEGHPLHSYMTLNFPRNREASLTGEIR